MTDAGPFLLALTDSGDFFLALHLGQLYRLHHGADNAIGQNEDGVAVTVGQVKGLVGQVHSFLHGGGSQNDHLKATVAGSLGGLEIILLGGLNGAYAGAAAGDISINDGDTGSGTVADAFALEGDAGAGGGGHGAGTNGKPY